MSTRHERQANKTQTEQNHKILKELAGRQENRKCADCKGKDPRWASTNLGIFICMRCAGVHRSLGTHISKVRSIDLDTWTTELVDNMVRWGNAKANAYWEGKYPDGVEPGPTNLDYWIRQKYESKKFAASGPIPNPDDIDIGDYLRSHDPSPAPKSTSPSKLVKETVKEVNLLDGFDDDHFGDFVSADNGFDDAFAKSSPAEANLVSPVVATSIPKPTPPPVSKPADPFDFFASVSQPTQSIQPTPTSQPIQANQTFSSTQPAQQPQANSFNFSSPPPSNPSPGPKSKDAIMALFNAPRTPSPATFNPR